MFIRNTLTLAFMTVGASLVGGSALAAETTAASVIQDARTKLFELIDKENVTVNFKAGSSTLEQAELDEIKALVEASKKAAAIESVMVASWADKDYPAGKSEKLSEADRKLANARADTIKKVLNGLGIATVNAHSMAENPSWISKAFNTDSAKLKGEGKLENAADNLTAEIGKKLKDKGGPGTAVVLVRHKGDFSAH